MKKLLTLTATCAILATPATAVQKCVALDDSGETTCHPITGDTYYNSPEWTTRCTNSMEGTEVQIHGVAVCTTPEASKAERVFQYGQNLNIDNFTKCWCKMISPVVSGWTYWDDGGSGQDFASAKDCLENCANYCTRIGMDMAQIMFSSSYMFD